MNDLFNSPQKKLFPDLEYAKVFLEDQKLGELQYIRNVKSNLIINLEKINNKNKNKALHLIGKYELRIADLERKSRNYGEVYDALFSAVNAYMRLEKFDIVDNIALKSLMLKDFDKKVKDKMYQILKGDSLKKITGKSFDYFKYVINQYVINNYMYNLQNINKTPLYIFQNLLFNEIIFVNLNAYMISIHPIYSQELAVHLDILEEIQAIIKKPNLIIKSDKYNLIEGGANVFENSILIHNEKTIKRINRFIEEFSHWNTKKIKKWEKETGLLDYFSTGESIL